MNYLNLGCGKRLHPSWTNVNFVSTGTGVIVHDLKEGIPFSDQSFDVVYHSHVLEHFAKAEAEIFLKECYRVLRPQGIVRVVVPDLEQITRMYIQCLENVCVNPQEWHHKYDWTLLEMYDQMVRNQSGGEMLKFLLRQDLPTQEFVVKRCGIEFQNIIAASQQLPKPKPKDGLITKFVKHIYRIIFYRDYRRNAFLKFILSPNEFDSLQLGRFRQSGEIHQWMYDHYSLSVLLENCGLQKIVNRAADESYIPNWTSFNLDTEPDGSIYKPDSLYMESIKPDL